MQSSRLYFGLLAVVVLVAWPLLATAARRITTGVVPADTEITADTENVGRNV